MQALEQAPVTTCSSLATRPDCGSCPHLPGATPLVEEIRQLRTQVHLYQNGLQLSSQQDIEVLLSETVAILSTELGGNERSLAFLATGRRSATWLAPVWRMIRPKPAETLRRGCRQPARVVCSNGSAADTDAAAAISARCGSTPAGDNGMQGHSS